MNNGSRGVLMVVGAYFPELSGAGLQCRTLIGRLHSQVDFTVLATTADRSLPVDSIEEGVTVHRVFVDPSSWWSQAVGAVRFTTAYLRAHRRFSIVHLHGFSKKSVLFVLLALAGGKKIAIKLTSFGHDDPLSILKRGFLSAWCYRHADLFFAVSPRFRDSYDRAGLPAERFRLIPNGVDTNRFKPADDGERARLRKELMIPDGTAIVLFVGFFSRDKQPDLLFDAWSDMVLASGRSSVLVFVGATRSSYYEVDESLADVIRRRAESRGLASQLHFVETTNTIERYYRAADIFAMPSVREGLPNALLEAMASGAACVATRMEGITDRIVDNGRSGLLVEPGDRKALAEALTRLATDPDGARRLGQEARRSIETRFAVDQTAREYLHAYRALLGDTTCAA